jgi:hypothetical protein
VQAPRRGWTSSSRRRWAVPARGRGRLSWRGPRRRGRTGAFFFAGRGGGEGDPSALCLSMTRQASPGPGRECAPLDIFYFWWRTAMGRTFFFCFRRRAASAARAPPVRPSRAHTHARSLAPLTVAVRRALRWPSSRSRPWSRQPGASRPAWRVSFFFFRVAAKCRGGGRVGGGGPPPRRSWWWRREEGRRARAGRPGAVVGALHPDLLRVQSSPFHLSWAGEAVDEARAGLPPARGHARVAPMAPRPPLPPRAAHPIPYPSSFPTPSTHAHTTQPSSWAAAPAPACTR